MYERRGVLMSKREFNQYLDEIRKYTREVSASKVSPKKSLDSLVKAGICDKDKQVKAPYFNEK